MFSVILPGSSALAAWIVGCGAWGLRRGAESSRSQPKHCLWRSGTQRGSMCSWRRRGVSGASLVRPGAVAQPHPGPSSTAQAFPVVSSGQRCPPRSRQPPGERRRRQEVRRATARGEPREALRPQSVGGGAVWGRRGNRLSSGRGSGPGFKFSRPVRSEPGRRGPRRGGCVRLRPCRGLQGLSLGCETRRLELSLRFSAVPSHGGTDRGSARPPHQLLSQKALFYLGIAGPQAQQVA